MKYKFEVIKIAKWIKADKLYDEAEKLWAEGDKLYKEGNKLWAEANKLYDEADKLWAEANKLYAEGDKLHAERNKLYAEGAKLWAEADKLWAEGAKLVPDWSQANSKLLKANKCMLCNQAPIKFRIIKNIFTCSEACTNMYILSNI